MKISLCMIVKPSDDEAKLLDRCLESCASFFDEINVTITGENDECERVSKKYGARISFFEWVDDYAKARNFNFSQATGDYIMWLDADDVLKNGHLVRETVEQMEKNSIDTVILSYLYDFDDSGMCVVRHLKTRIVKNDGCVSWVGAVHEDFHENREIRQFKDEKIEVIHLTDEKRARQSSERNLRIAKLELKRAKNDPRSFYLVANAYLAIGDTKNASRYLKKFLETSGSDEEKYLVNLTMADVSKDESFIHKAWSLRPSYPNAYFKMAELLFSREKYREAKTFVELGLQMPVPEDSIIVYNPREYDYVPLTLLTNICFELGEYTKALVTMEQIEKLYPKDAAIKEKKRFIEKELGDVLKADEVVAKAEKIKDTKYLKKYLDGLSPALRAHPKVCFFRNQRFVKETSSGKDLVFYCSYTVKKWTPENVDKEGVGGSEESVINIAKNLRKRGWNVTVYNNCGEGGVWDGVEYKPWWAYNVRDRQDVTVLWRHPKTLDFLDERAGRIFVDMHDVVQDGEFTKDRIAKIEKVFVKTNAHRILFPSLPDEKVVVLPNGIDSEMFEKSVEKNGYLVLNTSSADRHLESTLDIFEELVKRQPDKPWKLAWYYGWGVFDSVHKDNREMTDWKDRQVARYEKLRSEGRFEGGTMLSHREIAKKYLEAGVFLYPTQFYEIHCISVLKAQAAGCRVISSDFAALEETSKYGYKVHTDGKRWGRDNTFGDIENRDKYIEAILNYAPTKEYVEEMIKWAKGVTWEFVGKEWTKYI